MGIQHWFALKNVNHNKNLKRDINCPRRARSNPVAQYTLSTFKSGQIIYAMECIAIKLYIFFLLNSSFILRRPLNSHPIRIVTICMC